MSDLLPQQRLFIELLIMSGDVAVPDIDDGTMLFKTMKECEDRDWIILKHFGAGFDKASVTDGGRKVIHNRRKTLRKR